MTKAPYPHCDSNVLHAPGECRYCDMYPELQADRKRYGINFTGHGPDPATAQRPLEVINRWPGNRLVLADNLTLGQPAVAYTVCSDCEPQETACAACVRVQELANDEAERAQAEADAAEMARHYYEPMSPTESDLLQRVQDLEFRVNNLTMILNSLNERVNRRLGVAHGA